MLMQQRDAIAYLTEKAHKAGALIISEIGSQSVWLHDVKDDPSHLYLSGPMGMAPSVALGVALTHPNTPVLALCGDGALAMNATSLITTSHQAPQNLTLALMDNGIYEFTGASPSPSQTIDWPHYIRGLKGFEHYMDVNEAEEFSATKGLSFIHCKVKQSTTKPKPCLLYTSPSPRD